MSEIVLTSENFDAEVLRSDKPVLVDFWATWCGPCRMLGPVVAEIAKEKENVAKVGKVNVDEQPELANAYGISAIPTVMVFKDGKIVGTVVGVQPKVRLEEMLQ